MNTTKQYLSSSMIFLLAIAVGLIAANLYYAQPLVAQISHALGIRPEAAGLVVTLTQIGYGLGVLLIVPLGDILESRKLVITMICVAILGILGLAFVSQMIPYFIAAFMTGVGASTVQILVPYASHLTPEDRKGQTVGNMMSGLMIGIMLSRPVASLLTDLFSWHAVFVLSAGMMVVLIAVLYKFLPLNPPANAGLRYKDLLKSMLRIFTNTPLLRRRGLYQAALFGAFCLFWTATPLLLAGPHFNLSQTQIAIFALAGVAGAVVAPLAGKAADRGQISLATGIAFVSASLSFLLSHFFPLGSTGSLAALAVAAILLDAAVSACLVLGQRAIFGLEPQLRSRLNGIYIAMIFVGGASGSYLGAWAYARGGWEMTSLVGFLMPFVALVYFLTETKVRSVFSKSSRP